MEEGLDTMQLGFLEKEGGLLLREETSDFDRWDGGIAGGSQPCWLFPPSPHHLLCSTCSIPLTFLIQIYAPLDSVKAAFHRDLVLFICAQCSLVRCLRLQLSKKNPFYKSSQTEVPDRDAWLSQLPPFPHVFSTQRFAVVVEEEDFPEVEEEDLEEDEEDESAEGLHLCAVCSKLCVQRCGGCKQVYYCSVEHQTQDWKANHKSACADLKFTQRDMDEAAAQGDAKQLARLNPAKDKEFLRFSKRMEHDPDQVLRYQRWAEKEDSVVLWISTHNKCALPIPPCSQCGSQRKFEFQLLPQFLTFVHDLGGVDFGTIVVYTCVASCGPSQHVVQEFAHLQPEEDMRN